MGRKKELQQIKDVDKYRAQAQDAAAAAKVAAQEAAVHAKAAAKRAQDWAGPQVQQAKDWAAPRAQKAYHDGARKASPYVRRAGAKAGEWADVAHAAIVGAAIPAVISAVESAADEPKKSRGGAGKFIIAGALVAAGTAALVVWARRDPGRDEWAGQDDEWELDSDPDFTQQLRDNVNKAVDQVTDAAKKGADKAQTLSKDALDKAGPTIDKVKAQADEALSSIKTTATTEAEKVKSSVDGARSRATHAAVDAIDDAEDVWEDEGGSDESGETPAEKKPAK